MKLALLSMSMTTVSVASAHYCMERPPFNGAAARGDFVAAEEGAARGPCPMLNTLANHGFFPRDGRNITLDIATAAFKDALNFNATFAEQFWGQGMKAQPDPSVQSFDLTMLNVPSLLEHDASLSRADNTFGDVQPFNQSVFDETKSYWTADPVTIEMVANSMTARQLEMRAFNPNFTFTPASERVTFSEMAALFLVFGDIPSGTVSREYVVSWFENERLPTELGWTKSSTELTQSIIQEMSKRVANATSPITSPITAPDAPATPEAPGAGPAATSTSTAAAAAKARRSFARSLAALSRAGGHGA
ncbi:uncharacterized protein L3040_004102 [Drepanopeziza brunnea f. sp. 'multigermtubi']|uniref:Heme haloperoxidase family profile domain-containing protein n=1 Tax=Marssonina brunnea f. sp. multigermtubi (strain MB_m1) TaxID=1072389 RepID=K1WMB5_MARBU|nr:uncharacterized protein MBM_03087 [Drepanopeziza brunnea f. sp. 'multigermtubi' MB_m1]EKD18845.1 hypothetical protein MBM_03087 [Drepanopeziza brunnea f. sp. 'multigermtubi' MB_m1]KAJ5042704.1 hypothetical protein L3040_004102 [Drepanopeziza brunnea f. sp. 'multigermtubi']